MPIVEIVIIESLYDGNIRFGVCPRAKFRITSKMFHKLGQTRFVFLPLAPRLLRMLCNTGVGQAIRRDTALMEKGEPQCVVMPDVNQYLSIVSAATTTYEYKRHNELRDDKQYDNVFFFHQVLRVGNPRIHSGRNTCSYSLLFRKKGTCRFFTTNM